MGDEGAFPIERKFNSFRAGSATVRQMTHLAKKRGDWAKLARDIFERIDGNRNGVLNLAELHVVFHEQGQHILKRFDRLDGNGQSLDLGIWLKGIGQMEHGERIRWLMRAGSILAAFEREFVKRRAMVHT